MIRVVIADDEELVREGLASIVASQPDMTVVALAADGVAAVEETERTFPDVVLMDVRMPQLDGVAATREILRRFTHTRVLILTTIEIDDVVHAALRAGASGFLLKSVPREQLWSGIRTVASGEALLAPSITRRLIEYYLDRPDPSARPHLELTARQKEVVIMVAQGLSNREIANALHLSETTIKGYVSDVLHRHDLRDRVQLVISAYESGLAGRRF